MLSTKIRTAIIAIAASGAVAATAVAPVASANTFKMGTGHQVGETYSCAGAKTTYENYITQGELDASEGNLAGVAEDVNGASKTAETAKSAGCSWAAMISPTTSPKLVVSYPVRALS
jgi:hypothetical protein